MHNLNNKKCDSTVAAAATLLAFFIVVASAIGMVGTNQSAYASRGGNVQRAGDLLGDESIKEHQ